MEGRRIAQDTESDMAASARKAGRLTMGFSLVAAGVAMLVLPGPGLLTVFGGLAILGKDLAWAQRLSDRASAQWRAFSGHLSTTR